MPIFATLYHIAWLPCSRDENWYSSRNRFSCKSRLDSDLYVRGDGTLSYFFKKVISCFDFSPTLSSNLSANYRKRSSSFSPRGVSTLCLALSLRGSSSIGKKTCKCSAVGCSVFLRKDQSNSTAWSCNVPLFSEYCLECSVVLLIQFYQRKL